MAWEEHLLDLFEDLEQQAQALADAERAPDLADRSQAEYRAVSLASRLMASLGRDVTLNVLGPGTVAGRLDRVGQGWCLLSGAGQDWLVALEALQAVGGVSTRSVPEVAWPRVAGLGLAPALRRLADAAAPCVLHLRDGSRREGDLGRVGRDFVELREVDERVVLVPLDALAAAQSRD